MLSAGPSNRHAIDANRSPVASWHGERAGANPGMGLGSAGPLPPNSLPETRQNDPKNPKTILKKKGALLYNTPPLSFYYPDRYPLPLCYFLLVVTPFSVVFSWWPGGRHPERGPGAEPRPSVRLQRAVEADGADGGEGEGEGYEMRGVFDHQVKIPSCCRLVGRFFILVAVSFTWSGSIWQHVLI